MPGGTRTHVVRQEAAPEHEHPFVAQRREGPAEIEELPGVEAGHRDLEHGHVGGGIHRHERHIGPVVESALGVVGAVDALRAQQLADARGESGRARARVLRPVVLLREAVEVVDERHRPGRAQRRRALLPVRRNHQDALRPRHGLRPRGEFAHPRGVVEQDRRAVRREDGRHARFPSKELSWSADPRVGSVAVRRFFVRWQPHSATVCFASITNSTGVRGVPWCDPSQKGTFPDFPQLHQ